MKINFTKMKLDKNIMMTNRKKISQLIGKIWLLKTNK